MMRIDAHHHFWDYSAENYGWIGDGMDVLKRDFGPGDLKSITADAGIDGVISVQARTDLVENTFLTDYAKQNDFVKGVVGWVDLTLGSAGDEISRFSEMEKAVGLREILQGMEDDAYCLRDDFNRGVAMLHDFGLVYEILIFHRHLPNAIKLVDRHPDQIFVLDHVAKPDIQSARPDPVWAENIRTLAKREHVFCKLSGMVTEVSGQMEWTPENLRPYFNVVVEAFGPERLMFGSDWPVCLLGCEYGKWVACVESWTSRLSEKEQSAIWGETASRVYGLR